MIMANLIKYIHIHTLTNVYMYEKINRITIFRGRRKSVVETHECPWIANNHSMRGYRSHADRKTSSSSLLTILVAPKRALPRTSERLLDLNEVAAANRVIEL